MDVTLVRLPASSSFLLLCLLTSHRLLAFGMRHQGRAGRPGDKEALAPFHPVSTQHTRDAQCRQQRERGDLTAYLWPTVVARPHERPPGPARLGSDHIIALRAPLPHTGTHASGAEAHLNPDPYGVCVRAKSVLGRRRKQTAHACNLESLPQKDKRKDNVSDQLTHTVSTGMRDGGKGRGVSLSHE